MSVIRVHRKEKDFFIAKNEALENTSLSFKAKGLWAYAMSRKDSWIFNVAHLSKVSKESKTAIYSAIRELIAAGYCYAEQIRGGNGKWETMDYVIFETLADAEEFKKCLPHSGFPHAENQPLVRTEGNKDLPRKEKYTKEVPKVRPKRGEPPKPPSAGADALSSFFLKKMKDRKSDFMGKVTKSWLKASEKLINLRSPERIREVIDWVFKDEFWSGVVLCPNSLLKHFDRIEMQMEKKKPENRVEENKKIAQEIEQKFSNHPDIDIGISYIGFKYGPQRFVVVNYADHGFKEQIENNLRRMGLSL